MTEMSNLAKSTEYIMQGLINNDIPRLQDLDALLDLLLSSVVGVFCAIAPGTMTKQDVMWLLGRKIEHWAQKLQAMAKPQDVVRAPQDVV